MDKKIKVLIVDDSALIRQMFEEILTSDPDIEVLGTAIDAYDAREKIKKLNPDVVTLDIEMPKMNGIDFLEKIMSLRPTPVVMVSTLTQKGADETIKCLEIGAVDYVSKQTGHQTKDGIESLRDALISKVKIASKANIKRFVKKDHVKTVNNESLLSFPAGKKPANKIIAIGSSTGGVEALREVITPLPANMPPILIVQHMPGKFTKSFADRLNKMCALTVHEAKNGQQILPGNVYISPGDFHMKINQEGIRYTCNIKAGENVSGHCPSVDVLFGSVAEVFGKKAVGVILTGMGKDGANGMLKMRNAGSYNIGQNQASCVVYGMPKEANLLGGVHKELSLDKIPKEIIDLCAE